jgi:hypothetical protein
MKNSLLCVFVFVFLPVRYSDYPDSRTGIIFCRYFCFLAPWGHYPTVFIIRPLASFFAHFSSHGCGIYTWYAALSINVMNITNLARSILPNYRDSTPLRRRAQSMSIVLVAALLVSMANPGTICSVELGKLAAVECVNTSVPLM